MSIDDALKLALRLQQANRLDEAESLYQQIIRAQPEHGGAVQLLGLVRYMRGDHQSALRLLAKAVELDPDNRFTRNNFGAVLLANGQPKAALAQFDRALEISSGYAEAWNNRGNALAELQRNDEALISYERAQGLGLRIPDLHFNRGRLLHMLGQFSGALEEYQAAIGLGADGHNVWHNLGGLQELLGRFEDAKRSYERALQHEPQAHDTRWSLLHLQLMNCDWDGQEGLVAAIHEAIEAGVPAVEPFVLIARGATLAQQRMAAQVNAAAIEKNRADDFVWEVIPVSGRRIRVGYFSADFYDHATAHLIAELLERHDRERFELIGFSFGPRTDDAWQRRLMPCFDQFHDVREVSDDELVTFARGHGLDIAVDLKGYTKDARSGVFARRVAPVQVNFLGYPGTMGLKNMDYLIADRVVIPDEHRDFFSEKIVRLPHCYQPNDSTKLIAKNDLSREQAGLPPEGFVFCCFNNSYKITPDAFDVWMRLLQQTEGSVLWLLASNPVAVTNLRREAERRGVAGGRLVFAPRMALEKHLARHELADLFLDTFHYNAHTTASDALWAGLPVLTRLGDSFAGRVAASLLTGVGLPELIATTTVDYESMALDLSRDRGRLQAYRDRLREFGRQSPLFDCARFTVELEDAYVRMVQRRGSGNEPSHMDVS